MAQYAAHDGRARSQSMPFGYDPAFLAQQQNQMQFGFADGLPLNHQNTSDCAPAGGILDQTDNSLLQGFFNNPEITNQMNFNFDPMAEAGDEDTKPGAEGLFDLDHQSGTINNPAAAFAARSFGHDGGQQARGHSSSNSQRHSMVMGMGMGGGFESQEQSSDGPEEEETKAAVEGLIGMSANRPNPGQMMFGSASGGGFGAGATWGGINMNSSPFLVASNNHSQTFGGRHSNTHGSGYDDSNLMDEHTQAANGPFGYVASPTPQYHPQAAFGAGMGMHMQPQAHEAYQHGHQQSTSDFHGAAVSHSQHDTSRSAQLPNSAYSNYYPQYPQVRPSLNAPRYGSDENFSSNGYRPPTNYASTDDRSTNLNHVPFADEASANGHSSRQQRMQPTGHAARAHMHQASNSRPATPTYHSSNVGSPYVGGLPNTPNSIAMAYGGIGGGQYHGHAHPNARYISQPQQVNPLAVTSLQQPARQEQPQDPSSVSEQSDSDSNAPPSRAEPARKRHKSTHRREDEDEYQPPAGGRRRVQNSTPGDSSDEEYGRADSTTGRKRGRGQTGRRQSAAAGSSNTRAPTAPSHTRAPTVRRPSIEDDEGNIRTSRMSGSYVSRAPLTEEQRRMNHIKSEKSRRDLIKTNYEELNALVPALKNGKSGLSKSEVLREICEFIEELSAGNRYFEVLFGHAKAKTDEPTYNFSDEDDDA